MKKHVLYQLSVCIQVIHHYRSFLPNKNPSIYTSNSFVARAVRLTGRIGTDHPDTRLNWRFWCQKT